jgi:hypothetical protein
MHTLFILRDQRQDYVLQHTARTQWWLTSAEYLECCVASRALLLHYSPKRQVITHQLIVEACWTFTLLTFNFCNFCNKTVANKIKSVLLYNLKSSSLFNNNLLNVLCYPSFWLSEVSSVHITSNNRNYTVFMNLTNKLLNSVNDNIKKVNNIEYTC